MPRGPAPPVESLLPLLDCASWASAVRLRWRQTPSSARRPLPLTPASCVPVVFPSMPLFPELSHPWSFGARLLPISQLRKLRPGRKLEKEGQRPVLRGLGASPLMSTVPLHPHELTAAQRSAGTCLRAHSYTKFQSTQPARRPGANMRQQGPVGACREEWPPERGGSPSSVT